jgi:hypothetical protein
MELEMEMGGGAGVKMWKWLVGLVWVTDGLDGMDGMGWVDGEGVEKEEEDGNGSGLLGCEWKMRGGGEEGEEEEVEEERNNKNGDGLKSDYHPSSIVYLLFFV